MRFRGLKMITNDREYRNFEVRFDDELVELYGYPVVFEERTVMFEFEGIKYYEIIDRNAFSQAEMHDVVLVLNHTGKPFARTKNGTLNLNIDDKGVSFRASMKTKAGIEIYEDVKSGLLDKMSFAFSLQPDGEEYDAKTHTRKITGIKRLYDVSVVTFPAYEQTSVSARSFFEAEVEKERMEVRRAVELELQRYKYLEVK